MHTTDLEMKLAGHTQGLQVTHDATSLDVFLEGHTVRMNAFVHNICKILLEILFSSVALIAFILAVRTIEAHTWIILNANFTANRSKLYAVHLK